MWQAFFKNTALEIKEIYPILAFIMQQQNL